MKAILYDWGGLNVWLFQIINAFHTNELDRFMLLGSRLAEHNNFALYLGFITLGALVALHGKGKKQLQFWFSVIAVFILGYLVDGWVVEILKSCFSFPRPPLALPLNSIHLVGNPELNLQHSLPSGHASFAMLISASLWPVLNRYGRYMAIAFVVWVGISRISLGAHFPADVVAGALSCLIVVWLLRKLINLILR
jgi:membrane-associated phospholipid phosphatase